MIGLAKSCSGGGALGNYVLDINKGYELDRNLLCSETPKDIVEEMRIIQDLNQKATNKTFSMVLSPDIKDGKNLSDADLKEMTREYLTKLGINPETQQYIAFVHTEKEHKHIHIIANRVQTNGKLISDHYIGKRSQWVAHEIAKDRGLISAKEKMFENIKNNEQDKGNLKILKNEIFKKHQEVIRDKPRTFDNYIKKMNSKGLEVKPTINKQGQIQGFRILDVKEQKEFKASEIHRSMSVGNLTKLGLKNDLKNELTKPLKIVAKEQDIIQNLSIEAKRLLKPKTLISMPKTNLIKPKMTIEKYKFMVQVKEFVEPSIKLQTKINEEQETKNVKEYQNRINRENER